MTRHDDRNRTGIAEEDLPPLAPPDASDEEKHQAILARFLARDGAPTIEDFRSAYRLFRIDWPGDDEVRRTHPILTQARPTP